MTGERIKLGECRKPHGIKGGFSFHLYNLESSSLRSHSSIWLRPLSTHSSLPLEGKSFKIQKISFGNKAIAYLEGVEDRNAVEALLPFEIFVSLQDLPACAEDEIYLQALIGFQVIDADTKQNVGEVEGYYENGAQVVLSLKMLRGERFELPFVPQFFQAVDEERRTLELIEPDFIE